MRDAAGGFPAADRSRFDIVDALYSRAVLGAGYRFGALGEVRVYHAQSLRAKVEAGLGDRVEEDLRESHRAGWLSDEALEERLAELEEARRAAGR